jgi:hypothetical protein
MGFDEMKMIQRLAFAAMLLSGCGLALGQTAPTNFGSLSILNASIGDTFATQPGASTNPLYNFVDVYTFTYTGTGGTGSGSAISFANTIDASITNLQAAVFALPTSLFASPAAAGSYLASQGDISGALNPWTTMSLGTGSATTFSSALVAGTSYAIEIRGLVGSAGASYGGNLSITSVPEPSALSTLLLGGISVFLAARRSRRGLAAAA